MEFPGVYRGVCKTFSLHTPFRFLTLIHKSESPQKNRMIMGSTTAERKQHQYGCVFRLKPLVESFYAQYLWRTLLLFGESLPSHGDGQDFQDSIFVYKCQSALRNSAVFRGWPGRTLMAHFV